jgi:3-hydroxyacyl-CoA dehydrogenase
MPGMSERQFSTIGVIGLGTMGAGIAEVFARNGYSVVGVEQTDESLERGRQHIEHSTGRAVKRGKLSEADQKALVDRIELTTSLDAVKACDFVVEAIIEQLPLKQELFRRLDAIVGPDAILATNTSSLSVTEMAADLQHPERVVGFHFFNPVAVLPLLEIVRADKTDDASLATAFATGKKLGKSCVLVKDAPAFVVNRLLTRFLGEITMTVDEGTPIEVADSALAPLGLPMSPFVLLALVGPAVALHVSETMAGAFPDRFRVSENSRRLVEAGKTGIYVWDETGQHVDPEVAELFVLGDAPSTAEQVRERALAALADEVRRMLDEGVVAAAEDIDLCMLLGAGWPFHLGGITPYLDRTGVSEQVTGKRFLPRGVASVPA